MSRRGHDRERRIRQLLEQDGWIVVRAAGSLGPVDLVALRTGRAPKLIEVKSNAQTPFEHFGPSDREQMRTLARQAGATAVLAWWPPRRELRWIQADDWPASRAA